MTYTVFSVDAETDGLYGPVWAIGACVLDGIKIIDSFAGQLNPIVVTDRWVRDRVVPVVSHRRYAHREELLAAFWRFWMRHRGTSICVTDFGAPVEAGLFRACVELDPEARMWCGPYPMHELGTALLLQGIDPDINRRELLTVKCPGITDEFTPHDPLDDATLSGLCWVAVVGRAPTLDCESRVGEMNS